MGSIEPPNASSCLVYQTITEFADFPDHDQKLWWHSTAPMFAEMLKVAGYDIHSRYKALGLYQKFIIPFLGVYPTKTNDRWLSILTRYGTPFELSLNCTHSVVRYTFEPINAATGSLKDPFNTHAIWDALDTLIPLQKGIDLEFFAHLKRDLTVNDQDTAYLLEKKKVGGQIRTQNKLALDLKGGEFVLKAYIYPALKSLATGKPVQELMFDSVHRLSHQYPTLAAPLRKLEEYVHSRGTSSTASPRLISCDLCDPRQSRIKIYLLELNVSLESMEDLWTLGGRRNDTQTLAGLEMIRELWDLINLPTGILSYPEPYLKLGQVPNEQLPLMANYTLHHDDPMPEPQVYFTTFGMNDGRVTDGLATFFRRHGYTHMLQTYGDSLRAYYPHVDHDTVNYLHAYISFSYRKGSPYLSVYLQSFETGDWPISSFGAPILEPVSKKMCRGHPVSFEVPLTKQQVVAMWDSKYSPRPLLTTQSLVARSKIALSPHHTKPFSTSPSLSCARHQSTSGEPPSIAEPPAKPKNQTQTDIPGADPADRYAAGLRLNKEWAAQTARNQPELFPTLASGQTPQILWIGCSDSRCPETTFLGLQPGDVFVHRNIANILHPGDLSSNAVIEYAVQYLRVNHVVVCGHTCCGGVSAAMGNKNLGILDPWLFPLRQLRERNLELLQSMPAEEASSKLAELNVREGLNIVKQKSVVLNAIRDRGLQLHGLVYDVGSGVLSELDTQDSEEVIRARLTAFQTE
ncbi:hypothetical protein CBS147330_3414 [Penicillium roqueforti]|nr:hypothetical protein CBS147330_3414 [Penicillium roqueforti]